MKGKAALSRSAARCLSILLILAVSSGMFWGVATAKAEDYDPHEAGHPIKIIAYLVFPFGVLVDYALMRPAFWLVQKEPLATIFGYKYMHKDDDETRPRTMEEMLDEQQREY